MILNVFYSNSRVMWYEVAVICLIAYLVCSLWLLAGVLTQIHLLIKSRKKKLRTVQENVGGPQFVTIQVPVYNEKFVIAPLMKRLGEMDYPKHLFEIQVLDDSTDETAEIIDEEAGRLKDKGINISVIRRPSRKGFKAGALEHALPLCTGEMIAIFDADFRPFPDFLKRIVKHFNEATVGGVQGRWTHENLHESPMTTIQAFLLDTHFRLEQEGRSAAGYFMNFNGTAGVWRKQCIIDAGGWNGDVLTEDLELSYRAQLKGWQLRYDNEISVPAELPADINALKSQQFRWAKGMAQTARKHLATILRADVNRAKKWHAAFHLLGSLSFVAVLGNIVFTFPIIAARHYIPEFGEATNMLMLSGVTLPLMALYYYAGTSATFRAASFWKYFPLYLVVYMALSVQNSIGVLQGLAGKKSPFVRTPKTSGQVAASVYLKSKWTALNYFELVMIIYVVAACAMSVLWSDYFLLTLLLMMLTGLLILVTPAVKGLLSKHSVFRHGITHPSAT